MKISLREILSDLPSEWPHDLLPEIQEEIAQSSRSIVVLDDDPTGTQTVYDVPILTEWTTASLVTEFRSKTPLFYILTNSRSLSKTAARNLAFEIGGAIKEAAQQTGHSFEVISRSDSTLRGHFPVEVDSLAEAIGQTSDPCMIIPFFLEGGRYTIGDTHYVKEDQHLIPAHETPFAQDAVFGYSNSNMPEWVAEKTQGRVSADSVVSLSLDDIRRGGPQCIADKLEKCGENSVCVVNAASYRDLEVVTLGLLRAERQGKRFIYRTAASFVRVRAGLPARPLLTSEQLNLSENGGGLFIAGSYVSKTSQQLSCLLEQTSIRNIEIQVKSLLSETQKEDEINRVVSAVDDALANNSDVVVYTSRQLVTSYGSVSNLDVGSQISLGLVEVLRKISVKPRYLLAKGGITSSDLATKALGIKRGWVLGQILPGVPVWQTGPESRFPDLPYIVFPGNVGGQTALKEIIDKLKIGNTP